jgi:hypothetical protein
VLGKIINNSSSPSFIIIGSEKAGTTTISNTIGLQKNVYIPKIKEIHFFSNNWDKGLGWYKKYFNNNDKIQGEASPSYTDYPLIKNVPERIFKTLPEVKLIYVIRNPIKRIISQYRHALYYNWIPQNLNFEDAIKYRPQLIDTGRYHFQIEQYFKYFNKSQIKIICIEELNKPEYFKSIFKFLNIENPNEQSIQNQNKTGDKFVFPKYLEFARKSDIIRKIAGSYHNDGLFINRYFNVLKLFNREKIPYPKISSEIEKKLLDIYLPDIEDLSKLMNINLNKLWQINN